MSTAAQSQEIIPRHERAEIERRLGPGYRLDGSFDSLWAVEELLAAVRKIAAYYPEPPPAQSLLQQHCPWLGHYLYQLFGRAFTEMGLRLVQGEPHYLWTEQPNYRINIPLDAERLLDAPEPFPTLYGLKWEPAPELGLAAAPWYGLATIMQNHEWAETAHASLGERQDHLSRGYAWLVRQHLWSATSGYQPWQEIAAALVGAMIWPPLGYPGNERGEHNLPRIREICAHAQDRAAAAQVLARLCLSQDRPISLLAAQSCVQNRIAPTVVLQALALKRAVAYFGAPATDEIRQAIEQLVPERSFELDEPGHPRFNAALRVEQAGDREHAYRLFNQLCDVYPDRPVYFFHGGMAAESLSRPDLAWGAYIRVLESEPEHHPTLLKRGLLQLRYQRFDDGDQDLFAAQALRPDDSETRRSLLLAYLLRRLAGQ